MISFEVAGQKYQAGDLDIFDQMLITKRLMPVFKNIVTPEVLGQALKSKDPAGSDFKLDVASLFPAIADAIYSLSDEDARMIINMTLRAVQRQNQGGWSSVMEPTSGKLMFKDITLAQMLQIAWQVIQGHLGGFFSTAQ